MPTEAPTPSDLALLHAYVHTQDHHAFQTLATRHLNWIYSTALRITANQPLAEDATQAVLLALSQKAPTLLTHPSLPNWLFRATRYAALALLRSEHRRKHHEDQSMPKQPPSPPDPTWPDLAPKIDTCIAQLPSQDRQILLLRFYQQLTHAGAAATLNISEEAARKRTNRALEKLRKLLHINSTTTLAALLTTSLLLTAPKHLTAATLLTSATATTTASAKTLTAAKAIHTSLLLTKLKLTAATLLLILLPTTAATILLTQKSAAAPPAATSTPATTPADPLSLIIPPTTNQPIPRSQIHSYYLTSYTVPTNGSLPTLVWQTLFDLDHGTRDESTFPRKQIALDDGTHLDSYLPNDPHVLRLRSTKPPASRPQALADFLDQFTLDAPHPESDKTENNQKLSCYAAHYTHTNPQNEKEYRQIIYVWIDSQKISHQFCVATAVFADHQIDFMQYHITYNPTIPPELWQLPKDAIITTPVHSLDRLFPAKHAWKLAQSDDHLFAIHQFLQDPNGTYYLCYSSRLTDDAITSLGQKINALPPDLSPNLDPLPDFRTVPLATLHTPGFQVYFLALVPLIPNPDRPTLTITFSPISPDPAAPLQLENLSLLPPKPQPDLTLEQNIHFIFDVAIHEYKDDADITLFTPKELPNHTTTMIPIPLDTQTESAYKKLVEPQLIPPPQ